MLVTQILSYSLLILGFIQLILSFTNNSPYPKFKDKAIINKNEYMKENKKRHKINGIITLFMGGINLLSVGKYEAIVMLVGSLAFIFNFLFFNSNTREYLKDKNY